MDQPGLAPDRHRLALQGLARINRWSGSAGILWRALCRLAAPVPNRPWRILDIACGSGDVTRTLAGWAVAQGRPWQFVGCDLSPLAINQAQSAGSAPNLQFQVLDVLQAPLPAGFDGILCSLFLHHLDEPEAVQLLAKMAAAAQSFLLVNDLKRSRLGYALALTGVYVLSRSDVVHTDGPLSVAGAFTIPEVKQIAQSAGLSPVHITSQWPERFLLEWRRPSTQPANLV